MRRATLMCELGKNFVLLFGGTVALIVDPVGHTADFSDCAIVRVMCELLCESRWARKTGIMGQMGQMRRARESCRGLQHSKTLAREVKRVVFMAQTFNSVWPSGRRSFRRDAENGTHLTGVQRNLPRLLCSHVGRRLIGFSREEWCV
jgi:hypothetical protein